MRPEDWLTLILTPIFIVIAIPTWIEYYILTRIYRADPTVVALRERRIASRARGIALSTVALVGLNALSRMAFGAPIVPSLISLPILAGGLFVLSFPAVRFLYLYNRRRFHAHQVPEPEPEEDLAA